MKRSFKGVWIPKEIWLNKDLTLIEKIFLVEIDSLDNDNGCFASNKYFSDFFGVSKGRCTQIIKSLEAKKYVKIRIERQGNQIIKRVVKILNRGSKYSKQPSENIKGGSKYSKQPSENIKGGSKYSKQPSENIKGGSENIKGGYLENDDDNNTSINNTDNNTINNTIREKENLSQIEKLKADLKKEKVSEWSKAKEVLMYLNEATGATYPLNANVARKIHDLIIGGTEVQSMKNVIDLKIKQWTGKKYETNLTIKTLFGSKFYDYEQEAKKVAKNPKLLNQENGKEKNGHQFDPKKAAVREQIFGKVF